MNHNRRAVIFDHHDLHAVFKRKGADRIGHSLTQR
jgi:hypothetical protein